MLKGLSREGGARCLADIEQIGYTERGGDQGENKGHIHLNQHSRGIRRPMKHSDDGRGHIDIHVAPTQVVLALTKQNLHFAAGAKKNATRLEGRDNVALLK